MRSIGEIIKDRNIQLDTNNPVLQGGFTQVPNFILKDPKISAGAKVAYAMFLSYAWNNDSCFPGQDRLAEDMGMSRPRICQFVGELCNDYPDAYRAEFARGQAPRRSTLSAFLCCMVS
jgi:hypothetical protein